MGAELQPATSPGRPDRDVLRMLTATLDDFAAEQVRAEEIDRERAIPRRVLEGLAELGAFGVSLPEIHGGANLGLVGACRAVRTLAYWDRSVATTLGLHLGLGSRGLVAFGSPAQKQRWLPGLASGRVIGAFATTEAGAGSDLAAIQTRVRGADGALRVSGEKLFVTNGGIAGLYTVTAASPGLGGAARGHSLLLLEPGDPGVGVGAEEHKLGIRGSSTVSLVFDEVPLEADRILGRPGEGMRQMAHILAWGRTVMASGCAGLAEAALDRSIIHTTERRQFGRSLASFEVVQAQLAEMGALAYAIDAMVLRAADAEDDPSALASRSIAAKVLASDAACKLADTAVQLHGGSGFIEDTGVPLLLRDARITRIFEGANDVLLVHAGSLVAAGLPPRSALEGAVPPTLAATAARADRLHAELADRRASLLAEHGLGILRRQRLLHQLGSALILSEGADAVVLAAADPASGHLAPDETLASHAVALLAARSSVLFTEPEQPGAGATVHRLLERSRAS